jgi:hypothetical protein
MKRPNPVRTDARRIALCLALVVILLFPAMAAGVETESVESEGSSAIQDANLAQAREQAISLALRGALEKVLSSIISPQILADRKSVISGKVYPVTERYILGYRILREAEQDGAYAVRIAATVDSGSLKGDLRNLGVPGGQAQEGKRHGFRIGLTVQGTFASHHDFLAFRDLLSDIPGVLGVSPAFISKNMTEWRLETSKNSQAIARELSKRRFKGMTLRIVQTGVELIVAIFSNQGVTRE